MTHTTGPKDADTTFDLSLQRRTAGGQAPVRIAVCGEISSGKSTVINTLLRSNTIPHFIGSPWRPAVLTKYAPKPGLFVQFHDGTTQEIDEMTVFDRFEDVGLWIVFSDQPHLKGFEIIELPFFQEGDVSPEGVEFIRSSDLMIWVTIASQAWRLSEKTILDTIGGARPKHSVLVVSRADKLRSDDDLDKIRARLARETSAYFTELVFMHGANRLIEASATSDAGFERTAGADLIATLERLSTDLRPLVEPDPDPDSNVVHLKPRGDRTGQRRTEATPPPKVPSLAVDEVAQSMVERISDAMYGVISAGAVLPDAGSKAVIFNGEQDAAALAGALATGAVVSLAKEFVEVGDGVSGHATYGRFQLLYKYDVPSGAVIFMLCDKELMNHGIARTAFLRVTRCLEGELSRA